MAGAIPGPRHPSLRRPSINMQQYREYITAQQALQADRCSHEQRRVEFFPDTVGNTNNAHQVPTYSEYPPAVVSSPFASPALALTQSTGPPELPFQSSYAIPALRLRYKSALEAQMAHQWQPCWIPSSGRTGVPHNDRECIPHVKRLFHAFLDTRCVLDSQEAAARFLPGGMWMQGTDDVELVSWNLLQACMNLHIVGAVSLKVRRNPDMRPSAGSQDAKLSFSSRMFMLELALGHFKVFAHAVMQCQAGGLEEQLMRMHTCLMRKYKFQEKVDTLYTPEQRKALQREFKLREYEGRMHAKRSGVATEMEKEEEEEEIHIPVMEESCIPVMGESHKITPSIPPSPNTVRASSHSPPPPAHQPENVPTLAANPPFMHTDFPEPFPDIATDYDPVQEFGWDKWLPN